MSSPHQASLRRAAILLSSMPANLAEALLAKMPKTEAIKVRHAMAQLADVDPLERRRALNAMVDGLKPSGSTANGHASPAAQLAGGLANMIAAAGNASSGNASSGNASSGNASSGNASSGNASSSNAAAANHPSHAVPNSHPSAKTPESLQFLAQLSEDLLHQAVGEEHPQTVALVMRYLPAPQAARLLGGLDAPKRIDVVRRLARLQETPAEVLNELGEHLRGLVEKIAPLAAAPSTTGSAILADIAAHLDPLIRGELSGALVQSDPSITIPITGGVQASMPGAVAHAIASQSPTAAPTGQTNFVAGYAVAATPPVPAGLDAVMAAIDRDDEDDDASPRPVSFAMLEALPTAALRRVFAAAEESLALLALSGCRPETARRLLAGMPRQQSKQIERQLSALGSLTLRDVDRAQQALADLAWTLHQAGRLPELSVRGSSEQRRAA
jgi:flagellar motor switch protein FliG